MTSYIFFANEMIPKIKKEEKVNHMAATQKAEMQWFSLTEE